MEMETKAKEGKVSVLFLEGVALHISTILTKCLIPKTMKQGENISILWIVESLVVCFTVFQPQLLFVRGSFFLLGYTLFIPSAGLKFDLENVGAISDLPHWIVFFFLPRRVSSKSFVKVVWKKLFPI